MNSSPPNGRAWIGLTGSSHLWITVYTSLPGQRPSGKFQLWFMVARMKEFGLSALSVPLMDRVKVSFHFLD